VFPAIIDDFPLLDPPLEASASHEASATADFDQAHVISRLPRFYKNAMSFVPLSVTVYSAAAAE
jgi:hypothetical protein